MGFSSTIHIPTAITMPYLELFKAAAASMAKATAKMEAQASDMNIKQAEWQEFETRVQANVANTPHLITLDVSGTTFRTSKETLLAVEGSYFHVMLGSGHWKPDAGDAYFLDLHGPTFDRVLIFLKTGKLWLDGLNKCDETQLILSMDYLKLLGDGIPKPTWEWDFFACSPKIVLDSNRQTATKPSTTRAWSCVMGTLPVTSFQVRLDDCGQRCYVGLQPRASFKPEAPGSRGYYVRMCDGCKCTSMGYDDRSHYRGVSFTSGDLVAVCVMSNNKIHFKKNGQDLGDVFILTDPMIELYPIVCMYRRGAVTIVE
ncbi:Aste57867_13610 [Aphanomyces stellatus]|uniref:Aste57867_13610 protein n=1 Tax=Aphanomyces stellatus TaxID=120398 RepID=A0A485L0A6_9STRA|nr:hypothetical protein As57867_013560 [Aphanomyces stellatus]VFT90447.1 Aste57867_13610 [Aphanomyces stellatus]